MKEKNYKKLVIRCEIHLQNSNKNRFENSLIKYRSGSQKPISIKQFISKILKKIARHDQKQGKMEKSRKFMTFVTNVALQIYPLHVL